MLRVLHSRVIPRTASLLARTMSAATATSAPIAAAAGATPVSWTRTDGSAVPGYAFGKVGSPGVVVIQEWWGVDAEVLEHAKKLAEHGYRALVPDLYRGALGVEAEEAHHLFEHLDWPGAVDDIRGAARYLKEKEGAKKVGIVGFCMGGALTIASGVLVKEVDAVAPFYGIPPASLAEASKVGVPLQGHYGDKDAMAGFSDPAAVNALEEALKASGASFELHRYATVGHAFMNATPGGIARRLKLGQGEHDQAAVDTAWGRLFAFFDKHLLA